MLTTVGGDGSMGAMVELTHEAMRAEYVELAERRGVEAETRLFWPVEQQRTFTNELLGDFLEFARERSAWHRARLAGIDLSAVTRDDMSALPTMNKHDLHDNWDTIVTDPELTLDLANRHLGSLRADGFSFALGRYVVSATGGSTGVRSVIAADSESFATWFASNAAHARSSRSTDLNLPEVPVQGRLTALNPIHLSGATSAVLGGSVVKFVTVPPSTPIADAVATLNEAQPHGLLGYGSMLHLMAIEALAGRLEVEPLIAGNLGEPLLPETRAAIRDAFGIETRNLYGSTEAYFGESWRGSELIHLGDDTTVIELVDADNQPVPPGTRCAKLLVTNLANRLQPLIRYEITDEVIEAVLDPHSDDPSLHPPGPWTGRWIHPPQGRNDDWFAYDGTIVHPHIFRSQLAAIASIAEYQVTQTPDGADVAAVVTDRIDTAALGGALAAELRRVGLDAPTVSIATVDAIDRHPDSGKLRRFVPLPR